MSLKRPLSVPNRVQLRAGAAAVGGSSGLACHVSPPFVVWRGAGMIEPQPTRGAGAQSFLRSAEASLLRRTSSCRWTSRADGVASTRRQVCTSTVTSGRRRNTPPLPRLEAVGVTGGQDRFHLPESRGLSSPTAVTARGRSGRGSGCVPPSGRGLLLSWGLGLGCRPGSAAVADHLYRVRAGARRQRHQLEPRGRPADAEPRRAGRRPHGGPIGTGQIETHPMPRGEAPGGAIELQVHVIGAIWGEGLGLGV